MKFAIEAAAAYPYQPGKYGIPMQEILERIERGEVKGLCGGSSGRMLRYEEVPQTFSIEDLRYRDYIMQANCIYPDMIDFILNTDMPLSDSNGVRVRHPDMFAGKFVEFALNYLRMQGERITVFKGVWMNGFPSDNFDVFMDHYRKTLDKVQSAKATWSGKTLARYGFTKLNEENVVIVKEAGGEVSTVFAYFSLPGYSDRASECRRLRHGRKSDLNFATWF